MRHKKVSTVQLVPNYNMSHQWSLGCEPSGVFHGYIHDKTKILKWDSVKKIRSELIDHPICSSRYRIDLRRRLANRYAGFYQTKSDARKKQKLLFEWRGLRLRLRAEKGGSWKKVFDQYNWFGAYIVEVTPPTSLQLVSKVGSNKSKFFMA